MTVGAEGSVAAQQGGREPIDVPALQVEVVDTTGAGDAFVAGLSHSLAQGAPLQVAVQAAARVAAWTVAAAESVCQEIPERIRHDHWDRWSELTRRTVAVGH